MRVALVQFCGSDDPQENLANVTQLIRDAHAQSADLVLTPEVTNLISTSRKWQMSQICPQESDPSLAAYCALANELGIWLLIGSLALRAPQDPLRFVNRSFLINRAGKIIDYYDKVHMFDVVLSEKEHYAESQSYCAGARLVVADTEFCKLGMSICYDLRFAPLYRQLAQHGAKIIAVPAAFAVATGQAHWEILLRARAIETGAFILAPAQTGQHSIQQGRPRRSFGHSMVVAPWGGIIGQMQEETGVLYADLDLSLVDAARVRVPAWQINRDFAP